MIARVWHGWTNLESADTYENLLRDEMFPEIQKIEGSKGAYLLRREGKNEVEFLTITLFGNRGGAALRGRRLPEGSSSSEGTRFAFSLR